MSIREGKKAVRMIAKDYFEHPNSTRAYDIHSKRFWAFIDFKTKPDQGVTLDLNMKEEEIVPGIPVIFWGIIKNDGSKSEPYETVIMSEPWEVGGQMCCKVRGKSGCVSIKHLEAINP